MLTRAGYKPVLLVSEGWEPDKGTIFDKVKTRFLYPFAQHDPAGKVDDIDETVQLAYGQLNEVLPDGANVITHDLIFLPDYTILNIAARKLAADRPSIHWIHWVHSATNPGIVSQERGMYGPKYKEALDSAFPNSIIAYPNAYDIPRVAENFGFEMDNIVEVPHSTDPTEGMHPLVQRLYDERRLGEKDVIMILPIRLDRGKFAEANVRFIAGCQQNGMAAHLVICDFQSTGDDKLVYKQDLKDLANDLGVLDCVTFMSDFDDMAHMEIPHDIVLDLFELSNVFLLASRSETYSLIAQEAMLRSNLVFLNHDFYPFRQIYGKNAIYKQFEGANIDMAGMNGNIDTKLSNPLEYYLQLARNAKYYLEHDKILAGSTWVRKERNPDAVFKKYLEPLLNIDYDED